MDVPKELQRFGARSPMVYKKRRLVMITSGLTAVGKSRFMLETAPRPLLVVNLDMNLEPLEDKYLGKDIIIKDVPLPRTPDKEKDEVIWHSVRDMYETAIDRQLVRSVLIDTGDALQTLIKRACVGKLEYGDNGFAQAHGQANSALKWIFNYAKEKRVNLCVSHRMEDEYRPAISRNGRKIREATGKLTRAGWKDAEYESQLHLCLYKDVKATGSERYKAKIEKCTAQPMLEGEELTGDEINFGALGRLVFPQSTRDDWE